MTIIDRVKWDARPDVLAWKFPSDALSTWTQLIVNESQEAFVVKDGVYDGPFAAGRHTLSTENIPLLQRLIGLPFGGKSPFSAEVWFVNKAVNLDVKWGTSDPILVEDPRYAIMVPVRAFGQYGIRIEDARKFLLKLVGTLPAFDVHTLSEYFRGAFTTRIKTDIANAIVNGKFSILDIATQLDALSSATKTALADEMADYGVALTQFNIQSINVPDTDPSVQKLKTALARKAEMEIVGYSYQQERSFDVLQSAARNEGNAGSLIGTGLGAGMGIAMGIPMGQAFGQVASHMNPASSAPSGAPAAAIDPALRIQMLKDLADLRTQGILTDAEFEAEKRRILGT